MVFPDADATFVAAAPVLQLPLRVNTAGAMATVPQNSPEEISQSVGLLLDTRPGERRSIPDYGLPDQIGYPEVDAAAITQAIYDHEPRANPADVEVTAGVPGEFDVTVTPDRGISS